GVSAAARDCDARSRRAAHHRLSIVAATTDDYCIFATARPAASYIDTVRSQYSTPYLRRILKPSSSQAPGIRKIAIVSAGLRPAAAHPLMTPRGAMVTRE